MLKVTYLESWTKESDPKTICPDMHMDPGWEYRKTHRFIVHQKEGSGDFELVIGPLLDWYSYQQILEVMNFSEEGFRGEGIVIFSALLDREHKKVLWHGKFSKNSSSLRAFDSSTLVGCHRQVVADALGISVSFWYEDHAHPRRAG